MLSNVAFKCNLRHYTVVKGTSRTRSDYYNAIGGAVQVDPGLTLLAFNA